MRVSDNLNLSGLRPPSNSHSIYGWIRGYLCKRLEEVRDGKKVIKLPTGGVEGTLLLLGGGVGDKGSTLVIDGGEDECIDRPPPEAGAIVQIFDELTRLITLLNHCERFPGFVYVKARLAEKERSKSTCGPGAGRRRCARSAT
jgi:hypothetical protein